MGIGRRFASIALLAAVACSSQAAYPKEFQNVRITRTGGLWFCAEPGMVLDGTLTVPTAVYQGARAAPGDPARDTCLEPHASACVVRQEFAPTQLTAAQLDELRARIAAVPEEDCERVPNPCDPCLVTTIAVDGVRASGFCCGELGEEFNASFRSLEAYLDELARNAP